MTRRLALIGFLLAGLAGSAAARDASFVDPGLASGNTVNEDSIKVEPKNDIDIGEATINVSRRMTLFFINQTVVPVKIDGITLNADSNVTAVISNDDCTKQGTLAPSNRCGVELSITPNSPGPWSVETLMTHSGAGRITRAKVTGKTPGTAAVDKKDTGLALSSQDMKPVDFGEVEAGGGKAVRSALMVNDSNFPITLYSIDVIEAGNGLTRLDQGCAVDMELKPGESCPVTLVWSPAERGVVSTDLIIRHSGQLGFAVIPIRGTAKGGDSDSASTSKGGKSDRLRAVIPPPPGAQEVARAMADSLPAVSMPATAVAAPVQTEDAGSGGGGALRLIGTVGNRGVLLKPDGTTVVVQSGDLVEIGSRRLKVVTIGAHSIDIMIGKERRQLPLEASSELVNRARAAKLGKTLDAASGVGGGGGPGFGFSDNGGGPVAGLGLDSATILPATAGLNPAEVH